MKTPSLGRSKCKSSYYLYSHHPRHLRILIVSSHPREQKTLKRILEKEGHIVDQAKNKDMLLGFLAERTVYDLVIVSDYFDGIGLAFFALYFRKGMSKRRPVLVYLGNEVFPEGFDEHLPNPCRSERILQLLMKIARRMVMPA